MPSYVDVRVACPGCGPMVVPADEFMCGLDAAGATGLCELRCPVCSATVILRAEAAAVETMQRAGAKGLTMAPFELLEPHPGPPLSWDDFLDFKLALDASETLALS
jgi:hypothetical protein